MTTNESFSNDFQILVNNFSIFTVYSCCKVVGLVYLPDTLHPMTPDWLMVNLLKILYADVSKHFNCISSRY